MKCAGTFILINLNWIMNQVKAKGDFVIEGSRILFEVLRRRRQGVENALIRFEICLWQCLRACEIIQKPMQKTALFLFILLLIGNEGLSEPATSRLKVEDLKCEYRSNPLAIDTSRPRLSWILKSDDRDECQTACQIIAASSLEKLNEGQADVWNSGVIRSSNSVNITYAGKPLHSGQRVYWKVRVWDRLGNKSRYSRPAWWEMGLLSPADWSAKWIVQPEPEITQTTAKGEGPAPLFRDEFTVTQKVARARIYASGLGYYELHLNGSRVGNNVLDPGWTTYSKRVLYSTYDVTKEVKQGRNAIGIMAGNGWFNPLPLKMWGKLNLREHLITGTPRVILQLVIEFADGTSKTIVTDDDWKVHDGPILSNSIYLGETYDARKEPAGWDKPGFDDSNWPTAALASQSLGELKAQSAPPIRITQTIKPVALTEPKPGVYLFDLGKNFAGWIHLRVKGSAGTCVQLRYGELLYPDGTLNGMTSACGQIKNGPGLDENNLPKTAFQIDRFILRGGGREEFTPHFTFHGFRYVEVTGLTSKPDLNTLEGLRLNSDVTPAGSFECSNELFNRIQQMVLRTELSNLFSVQSDCPHREKFGYGGDIVAAGEAAVLNFDMCRFYAKTVQDMADAVRTNGGFTETSPYVGISDEGLGGGAGPIGWGTAQPYLQWLLYQYYGDQRLLEEQYETTKKWIALLQSCSTNYILDNGISDHESLDPKPRALTGTAFYYLNLELFSKIARTLGRESDAAQAEALAGKVKDAFNRRFLKGSTGQYDSGTQTCQSFALYLGLVPVEAQNHALQALVQDIGKSNGHLRTGIFGTKYLLNTLSENGMADAAYTIVNQKTFPGWGYMLENGATTLWEHWAFSDNIYSHNHPMFGSVSEWFYKALGGINPAPDAVGFDKIIIKPQPVNELRWVKASYNSVRGEIVSQWKRTKNNFQLKVVIPVGTTAMVYIPAKEIADVEENGRRITNAPGVEYVKSANGCVIVRIGSGKYEFKSAL